MYDVDSKLRFPLDLQLFAENGDDHPSDNNDVDTGNSNSSSEGRTFTQEELDNIIKDRIAKERKQWEKQLEDEKTEAEKLKT